MPRQPNALRSIFGIAATSLFAGPSVLWLSIALLSFARLAGIEDGHPGEPTSVPLQDLLKALLIWTVASILVGIWISVPASIANAIALNVLASRACDSSKIAALVGFAGGCIILGALLYMRSLPPPFTPFSTTVIGYPQQIAVVVTGMLMGIVYWLVAIRPCRLARAPESRQ